MCGDTQSLSAMTQSASLSDGIFCKLLGNTLGYDSSSAAPLPVGPSTRQWGATERALSVRVAGEQLGPRPIPRLFDD
jgi:hypothetical protein